MMTRDEVQRTIDRNRQWIGLPGQDEQADPNPGFHVISRWITRAMVVMAACVAGASVLLWFR